MSPSNVKLDYSSFNKQTQKSKRLEMKVCKTPINDPVKF